MSEYFDYDAARIRYQGVPEFEELEATMPDALAMVTSHKAEAAVVAAGGDIGDFWSNIGKGEGGFYDQIREDGCTACGCYTPGNCDACA